MPANSETLHSVMIGAHAYGSEGLAILKEVVALAKSQLHELTLSSVYSVKREMKNPDSVHDLLSVDVVLAYAVVLRCRTTLSPVELQKHLKTIEVSLYKKHRRTVVALEILFYEDSTQMLPQLTLPFPDFHLVPEFVIGAAEVWGEFEHPVLKKTMYSLTQNFSGRPWGEFFTQGKALFS